MGGSLNMATVIGVIAIVVILFLHRLPHGRVLHESL